MTAPAPPDDAVVIGIGRTGRLVTSAGANPLPRFRLALDRRSDGPESDGYRPRSGHPPGCRRRALPAGPGSSRGSPAMDWYLPSWLARALWIREHAAPRPAGPGPEGGASRCSRGRAAEADQMAAGRVPLSTKCNHARPPLDPVRRSGDQHRLLRRRPTGRWGRALFWISGTSLATGCLPAPTFG